MVAKAPDPYLGDRFVIFGRVTQFEAATGKSAFRANSGTIEQESSYQFDVNTLIGADSASQVGGSTTLHKSQFTQSNYPDTMTDHA